MDREKMNKRHREWARKKRDEYIDNLNELRYNKNKIKAIEYTGCIPCHNPKCEHNPKYLHHIDFHHVIAENKTRPFGYLFRKCKWETIQKEIDDCKAIPLCAMCHRDIERIRAPEPLNTPEELE